MSLKAFILAIVGLMVVQTFIIIGVTRANEKFFTGPSTQYARALSELAKAKPTAALVIRICYGLFVLELLAVAVAKYVFGLSA